jgi:diadenosine tetraphosphate (Ap4A) HIT family hydrolase
LLFLDADKGKLGHHFGMPTSIHRRVALANSGKNPLAIIRLKSGWVMVNDPQVLDGYCLLLSDPVAPDLNSLDEAARAQYCLDMIRVGDALMKIKGAYKINYETWGNLDPALHTHIVPRYREEPDDKRVLPAMKAYDAKLARNFDANIDQAFIAEMRIYLKKWQRS